MNGQVPQNRRPLRVTIRMNSVTISRTASTPSL
jgi:hypothetical protein